MTAPRAGPCDSPQVVTEKMRPKLFPAKVGPFWEREARSGKREAKHLPAPIFDTV
ncbi:hypothetical protein SBDP1_1100004 [Syntrophobacter sp. SbD1]|nr:hypothetical protein SBDP1_1100004 [Syntrophobacter sp. SbD1]